MGRFSTNEGSGDFQQLPPGSYVARCIRLIDLGTQHGEYMGKPTVNNQVMIVFETPDEKVDVQGEMKPYIVSLFVNNWLGGKSKLKGFLESWRGKAFTEDEAKRFDLESVLGKPAMITVVHNDKGKAKITGVGKLVKGSECPPATQEVFAFWLDSWHAATFEKLPKGIQDIVARSDEYKIHHGMMEPPKRSQLDVTPQRANDFDDDIPF